MGVPRRVAAIDIGTNTVLLLVAEESPGAPRAIVESARITRLGQGVDRTRRLAPEAIQRTAACLAEYRALADAHGASTVHAVCTSAARDAENGGEFLRHATAVLGVPPRIIDGREEARLTFEGALTGLPLRDDVAVFDVGGGSTEIIIGVAGDEPSIEYSTSLDVGSVRLTERHVRHDPPLDAELARVRADIEHALLGIAARPAATLVGVAGTVTTLAAMAIGLVSYDSARVHGSRLRDEDVRRLALSLSALPLTERKRLPGLDPARADVIVAGTVLVQCVLAWHGAHELWVSDRGVRWGLAKSALAAPR